MKASGWAKLEIGLSLVRFVIHPIAVALCAYTAITTDPGWARILNGILGAINLALLCQVPWSYKTGKKHLKESLEIEAELDRIDDAILATKERLLGRKYN